MRTKDYEVLLDLDLRIYVEYGGRPVDDYAVMLQILVDGEWRTVFLVDNAHETHHCHRYCGNEKGDAEPFFDGPDAQAIRAAVEHMVADGDDLVEDWRRRTTEAAETDG